MRIRLLEKRLLPAILPETLIQQQHELSLKNACVEFMFAYQQKNVEKMLSFCNPDGIVEFMPMGKGGKGKIGELGKAIWSGLIECFPDIDRYVFRFFGLSRILPDDIAMIFCINQ